MERLVSMTPGDVIGLAREGLSREIKSLAIEVKRG